MLPRLNPNDPDVLNLLKRPYPPRVEDAVLLAKKLRIDTPHMLWNLLDELTELYYNYRYDV